MLAAHNTGGARARQGLRSGHLTAASTASIPARRCGPASRRRYQLTQMLYWAWRLERACQAVRREQSASKAVDLPSFAVAPLDSIKKPGRFFARKHHADVAGRNPRR